MLCIERIGNGMYQRKHAHQAITRHQRHTDRGFGSAFISRIISTAQPAVIFTGIGYKRRFAVLHHPSRKAPLDSIPQLLSGVIVELFSKYDGGIHRFAKIIHHYNTAALSPHILKSRKKQTLQNRAKVQSSGDLTADVHQ